MLIEAEKIQRKASGRTPADIEGIIVAINDVYDHFPEKFGNESKRTRLKNDIRQFLSEPRVPEDFFSFFAKAMESVGIANPFASLSLAFVGGYDSHDKYGNRVKPGHDAPVRCTYDAAMPVISMFGRFHDIAVHKTGLLETENSLAVIGGKKVDYVITGNVINAPDNPYNDDTILACGSMLKKGGRAIHLLHYGEDSPSGKIENPYLQRFAGQRHIQNIPPGDYNSYTFEEDTTRAMILEQVREVHHSSKKNMYWFWLSRLDLLLAPDRQARTIQGDGQQCSDKALAHYFLDHPDELEAAGYPNCFELPKRGAAGLGAIIRRANAYAHDTGLPADSIKPHSEIGGVKGGVFKTSIHQPPRTALPGEF